jgi:O-acetyl-ADP-ribose deacetylase (regulator of RNase III)
MAGCGTKIPVSIPTKYSAKVIDMPCGSTGIYGYPNLCDKCEKLNAGRDWRREAIEDGENWDETDY